MRSNRYALLLTLTVCLMLAVAPILAAPARQPLVVNSYYSDPASSKPFEQLVAMFSKQHPEYDVTVNVVAHEDFKILLRTWLNSADAPDVVTWMGGERMRYFARKDLLAPVDAVYTPSGFDNQVAPAFRNACSFNGKLYLVPRDFEWWAVYYRKSIFEKHKIPVPQTWPEFLDACDKLKKAGLTPIAIGTKNIWPAAGWFGVFNLRVNGLDFYQDLCDGTIAYTDPRLKNAMDYWKVLLERGCFLDNHSSYGWREAAAFIYRGEAAMMLMGSFITDDIPASLADDFDFFRFPVIRKDVGLVEQVPVNGFMIPARAKNKDAAVAFLKFMASKEAQDFVADTQSYPVVYKGFQSRDPYLRKGFNLISGSDGAMQFYDIDTDPEMADIGMNALVEFMMFPARIDTILKNLEVQRQRIFK